MAKLQKSPSHLKYDLSEVTSVWEPDLDHGKAMFNISDIAKRTLKPGVC